MTQGPLISVIVPVYNVEHFLDPCMQSIVAQTYANLEILLVDDGSTDGCPAMCDNWAKKDQRVRVFHQPNGGLSAARNTALDAMQGELVTMVDSDDVVRPPAIEMMYQAMIKNNANIVVGDYTPFDEDGTPQWPEQGTDPTVLRFPQHRALRSIFYQMGLTHSAWGRLYEASLFEEIRYPVGKNYEDLAIIYPLVIKCGRIAKMNYTVYGYRQRRSSILGAFSPSRAVVLDILENLEQQATIQDQQFLPPVRSRLLSAYFNILLLSNQDKSADHSQLQDRCWQGIKRLRHGCLRDSNVRRKNKLGIIASYLGRGFLCNVVGRNYQPKP